MRVLSPLLMLAVLCVSLAAFGTPAHAAPDLTIPPPPPPPPPPGAVVVVPPSPAVSAVCEPCAPVCAPVCAPAPCAPCGTDAAATGCPKKPFDLGPCWAIRLGAYLSLQTGNTESFDVKFDGEIEKKPDPWGFRVSLAYVYGEKDGALNAENWHGLARVERKIASCAYAFAEVLYDRDIPALLEYRFSGVAGAGCTIIDRPNTSLKGEAGLGGVLEKYENQDETFDPSAYLGARFEQKWAGGNRFFADFKFLPNLNDFDLSRAVLDTGLEIPCCDWLKFSFGLRMDYQIDPPDPTIEEWDLLFTAGVKVVL